MKKNIGVIFGSRSCEHDVSIITGLQAAQNMDSAKYDVTRIYIDKHGEWEIKKGLRSLLRIIEGEGNSAQGVAKAKETYEFVTGDEFVDRAAAEKWLAEEYEPPEPEENPNDIDPDIVK